MKRNRFLLILLAVAFCLCFSGCNSAPEEIPEVTREDLAAMPDDQLIPVLLDHYAAYTEPSVFTAELSWVYRSGETVVASMEGAVRSTGADRVCTLSYSAGETVKQESYIYAGGICYFNAGTKQKIAVEAADVSSYLAARYPVFGKVSDYNFADNELLRSEDGTYSLVLFIPANGIADSADITSPLTAAGNAEAPVTMSDFSDIYLTLRFSAEGELIGQTLGFDCKMTADGVETEGTVLFKFRITSTDPVQNPISAPEDADSYRDAESNPFAPTTVPESGTSGEDTSSDGE